jgi:hypothetical protein
MQQGGDCKELGLRIQQPTKQTKTTKQPKTTNAAFQTFDAMTFQRSHAEKELTGRQRPWKEQRHDSYA